MKFHMKNLELTANIRDQEEKEEEKRSTQDESDKEDENLLHPPTFDVIAREVEKKRDFQQNEEDTYSSLWGHSDRQVVNG